MKWVSKWALNHSLQYLKDLRASCEGKNMARVWSVASQSAGGGLPACLSLPLNLNPSAHLLRSQRVDFQKHRSNHIAPKPVYLRLKTACTVLCLYPALCLVSLSSPGRRGSGQPL